MAKPFTSIEITTAWAHVVPDTLRFDTDGLHAGKQTVEIRTRSVHGDLTDETRRIATSDLFQCFWSVETKAALDKARRSAKRMLQAGKETPEHLQGLDSMWRAQVDLCSLDHPRIHEARAKLAGEAKADEAREERKAKAEDPAAALGVG